MSTMTAGMPAPDFTLPANGGTSVSLSGLRGGFVILFFYPKDDTSGCTTEALDFTRLRPEFDRLGATLVGMSPDSAKRHDKFVTKHDLSVTLAADEALDTLKAYGVWVEKSMYGRTYMGVERTTLLIDREGIIVRVWPKVRVKGHADEVLEALRALA